MDRPEELLTDEIVAAAAGGAREAIDRVATTMRERIRLMVCVRLHPTVAQLDAVEEITQQVMEALLKGLSGLTGRTVAGLRAFVSTIVARRVADYIRDPVGAGRGKAPFASLDSTVAHCSSVGPLWRFLSASATSPLSAADREEQFRRAMIELNGLKEQYRMAITLAFFDQLTTAQIAERMGVSRQAAAMTLLRAVRALRERITGVSEAGNDGSHEA